MDKREFISGLFPANSEIVEELVTLSSLHHFESGTEILREGQYVKVIPFVISGLIKVYTKHEDKELLLYYIEPNESCVMSFSTSLKNEPSSVFAITEEDTELLAIPADKIPSITQEHPGLSKLFFSQYKTRYSELLDTIHHILFERMDARVLSYLQQKLRVSKINPVKVSHRQISQELGTAREVISRVMKKLEAEGKIIQHLGSIELLETLSGD